MKYRLLILGIFFNIFQRNVYAEPLNKTTWIDKIQTATQFSSVKADFLQIKVLQNLDLELRASGKLAIEPLKGQGIWTVMEPIFQKVTFNAKQISISQKEKKTMKTKSYPLGQWSEGGGLGTIFKLMIGQKLNHDQLQKQFTFLSSKKNSVRLRPVLEASGISEIILHVGPEGYFSQIEFLEKSKDTIKIILKNIITKK